MRNLASTSQFENASLKMFESSLKDGALRWFRMLRPQSLRTWAEVTGVFYKKYFPESKIRHLTRQIQGFQQERGESFLRCWERFTELLFKLPHHGFNRYQLVGFFHLGINVETSQQIEFLCKRGDFLSKTADEAWDFLEELADKYRGWESLDYDRSTSESLEISVVPVTNHDQQLQTQVEELAKQVKELSMQKNPTVNEVRVEEGCAWCFANTHVVTSCPEFIAMRENRQPNCEEVNAAQGWNPYSQTYDQGWSSHPNSSWSDPNPYGGGKVQLPVLPPPEQPYQQTYYPWPQQDQLNQYDYTQVSDGHISPIHDSPPNVDSMSQGDVTLEVNSLEESISHQKLSRQGRPCRY